MYKKFLRLTLVFWTTSLLKILVILNVSITIQLQNLEPDKLWIYTIMKNIFYLTFLTSYYTLDFFNLKNFIN